MPYGVVSDPKWVMPSPSSFAPSLVLWEFESLAGLGSSPGSPTMSYPTSPSPPLFTEPSVQALSRCSLGLQRMGTLMWLLDLFFLKWQLCGLGTPTNLENCTIFSANTYVKILPAIHFYFYFPMLLEFESRACMLSYIPSPLCIFVS